MQQPCAYILAGRRNGTLYTGVTSNSVQCVWSQRLIETTNATSDDLYESLL